MIDPFEFGGACSLEIMCTFDEVGEGKFGEGKVQNVYLFYSDGGQANQFQIIRCDRPVWSTYSQKYCIEFNTLKIEMPKMSYGKLGKIGGPDWEKEEGFMNVSVDSRNTDQAGTFEPGLGFNHIVLTMSVAEPSIVCLYKHGVLFRKMHTPPDYTLSKITRDYHYLGGTSEGEEYCMNGTISYVRMYNRELTPNEITSRYTTRNTPSGPQPHSNCCKSCGRSNSKLRCSMCKLVIYCSNECALSHWKFHKKICFARVRKKKSA